MSSTMRPIRSPAARIGRAPETAAPAAPSAIDPRLSAAFAAAAGFSLESCLITLQVVGSRSHNTMLSADDPTIGTDTDLVAVILPTFERTVGLTPWTTWRWQQDELDVTVFSLAVFMETLIKSSPNALAMLWARDDDTVVTSEAWRTMVAQRATFASRGAYAPFVKYGESQFRRMQPFDAAAKTRWDAAADVIRAAGWTPEDVVGETARPMPPADGPSAEEIRQASAILKSMHTTYFAGRLGAKRKALIERFGYDVKMGAHTVRLLRMCVEFLRTGVFQVFRTHDAAELRAIKRGDYTLEQVRDLVEPLFEEALAAFEASPLPIRVQRADAEALLLHLYRRAWDVPASAP